MNKEDSAKSTAVAIFVYNRPGHTVRLIDSVLAARNFAEYQYYVFSDGPKLGDPLSLENVEAVRAACARLSTEVSMNLICAETNIGLATSIVHGIDYVLKDHESVIALEDDLVVSPDFFEFMSAMLSRYYSAERVFQISGYMVQTQQKLPGLGLFRVPGSWGWATWRRAWAHYDDDVERLVHSVKSKGIHDFNVDGAFNHFETLCRNQRGELSTWAIRWYASMFVQGGFALYPCRSLVENHGFDGSGTNCGKNNIKRTQVRLQKDRVWETAHLTELEESADFLEAYKAFYKALVAKWVAPSFKEKLLRKFRGLL